MAGEHLCGTGYTACSAVTTPSVRWAGVPRVHEGVYTRGRWRVHMGRGCGRDVVMQCGRVCGKTRGVKAGPE